MAKSVRKAAGAVLGSVALTAMPGAVQAAPEPEDNSSFPGALATPGVTIDGTISFNGGDEHDFFRYTGLTPGSFFDVFVQITPAPTTSDILVEVLENPLSTIATQVLQPGDSFLFDNLVVPANGEVVVGVTQSQECCEGYQLRLDAAAATVPQPAALALVSAGLVGLGLHVARRRRSD